MSQNSAILSHVRKHGKIDPMTALRVCGSWALSSRVPEINRTLKREKLVGTLTKGKNGKRYSVYRMVSK